MQKHASSPAKHTCIRYYFVILLLLSALFLFLLQQWSFAQQQQPSLRKLLRNTVHTNNTVLVVSFNYAYLDMFYNFLCHLPKHLPFLIVAQDASLYKAIYKQYPTYLLDENAQVSSGEHHFREGDFNKITMAKIEAVKNILQEGYNVLFSDVDVVWLENVWPMMTDACCDLVFQPNTVNDKLQFDMMHMELNSGVYFARSNARTIALLEHTQELARKNRELDDQTLMAQAIRERINEISFKALDAALFATGNMMWHRREELNAHLASMGRAKPALVHANFLMGKQAKIDHLKQEGLWCK